MKNAVFLCLVAPLALVGCGASSSDEQPTAAWDGATPHFRATGFINDEKVDVAITGNEAADGSQAWCGREYLAPRMADGTFDLTRARHNTTEIAGKVVVNGEARTFELELLNHAFQGETPGAKVNIVPRVDGSVPPKNAVWADWEWHTEDGGDLYEGSAQDGTFQIQLFSGTPGEGGIVIPSGGLVGGLLQARWSVNESLTVSFTVPCNESEVEEE